VLGNGTRSSTASMSCSGVPRAARVDGTAARQPLRAAYRCAGKRKRPACFRCPAWRSSACGRLPASGLGLTGYASRQADDAGITNAGRAGQPHDRSTRPPAPWPILVAQSRLAGSPTRRRHTRIRCRRSATACVRGPTPTRATCFPTSRATRSGRPTASTGPEYFCSGLEV